MGVAWLEQRIKCSRSGTLQRRSSPDRNWRPRSLCGTTGRSRRTGPATATTLLLLPSGM